MQQIKNWVLILSCIFLYWICNQSTLDVYRMLMIMSVKEHEATIFLRKLKLLENNIFNISTQRYASVVEQKFWIKYIAVPVFSWYYYLLPIFFFCLDHVEMWSVKISFSNLLLFLALVMLIYYGVHGLVWSCICFCSANKLLGKDKNKFGGFFDFKFWITRN